MQLWEETVQEIEYNASKLIYILAGDDKINYDSYQGTEVFDFYRLLWVHEDILEERKKRLTVNNNSDG